MTPTFTKDTIPFLTKAGKQKRPEWLDKNLREYETVVKRPFVSFAETLKRRLQSSARGYHFPTKGIGRIKRPAHKVAGGEAQFKSWLSIIAARPTGTRFENNPHLFFGILPHEEEWQGVYVAGGLYRPSGRQLKAVRLAIAEDASAFHELFADPAFKARFKDEFSAAQKSTRPPKGFAPDHPEMEWLKLKRFLVLKKIPMNKFTSSRLDDELVADFTQLLRLNELLERAISDSGGATPYRRAML